MAYTNKEEQFLKVFKNSIKIDARTISVKTLLSDRNLRRIDYTPYYQRNYVWDNIKQSFFIESVILGTEIPPLIFFKSGLKIEVIDGRQRFETLKKFKENDITLTGKGLMSLVNLAKQSFNKLKPESLKEIFLESNIRVFEFEIVNEPDLDPYIEDKVKKEIFRRYNTGITPLTVSEVDNAKYNEEKLSDLFKTELRLNSAFSKEVKDCFFSGENDVTVENLTTYLRRIYILNKFPISKYAGGKERTETLDLLYNFTTQEIVDFETEFRILRSQISQTHAIYTYLTNKDSRFNNKLIYECIIWALRIINDEGKTVEINDHLDYIYKKLLKNLHHYAIEGSHYYGNIISRFSDSSEIFEKISGVDFSVFIRNNNFKQELKKRTQAENDTKIIDQFDHLRINKPAPISTPIDEIRSDVKTNRYLVRPSYQRQERISIFKASSIIESILLGINLPPIFVFKKKSGVKEVIDGQQRLLSVIGFLGEKYLDEEGKLNFSKNNSFKLKGLKILTELNGSLYSGLSESQKDKILDFDIDVIIIDENINPDFEGTDLFIRLNNKPYPIQQNSFEMWNSTVDAEIIQKIKDVTKAHLSWFYSKETSIVAEERNDRMENEELITILSYMRYNKDDHFDKIIAFFNRQDRITCRIKNKAALTDFLVKLEKEAKEKVDFLKCIEHTDEIILKLKDLLGGTPTKEAFNSILNVKNITAFRRSFQDFYIIWIILVKLDKSDLANLKSNMLEKIKDLLKELKNVDGRSVDDAYLNKYIRTLETFYK
jgi:hypothetical protein